MRRATEREEGGESPTWLLFTVKRHGAFEERHGYAFYVRGFHCFEVHAWVRDRRPDSERQIKEALEGLEAGEDKGCGLRVARLALLHGKEPLDVRILAEAGREYLEEHPALAARVLGRARDRLKPETLKPEEEARLLLWGGLARLGAGAPAEAIEWLAEAERRAAGEAARQAAYHLARAASAAERMDEAFAALDRAFAAELVVPKARLSKEKELENARKDPRWEEFWMARIQGK